MRVTEEQAREKWCPDAEVNFGDRFRGGDGSTNCLGSRCMAWRWADAAHATGYCGRAGQAHAFVDLAAGPEPVAAAEPAAAAPTEAAAAPAKPAAKRKK